MSKRRLAAELAARLGTDPENERRTLNKYVGDQTVPSPERAAELAVLLSEPSLALVPPNGERRTVRLQELEEEVQALTEGLELARQAHKNLLERVEALETAASAGNKAAAKRPARRTQNG